ncbi:hypothetical protein ASG65_18665 [Bacillus sp. Leaf13]|nr:hypothetical protein ASG65_18665 [Bacillus sp. Leaf13]
MFFFIIHLHSIGRMDLTFVTEYSYRLRLKVPANGSHLFLGLFIHFYPKNANALVTKGIRSIRFN